MQITKRVTLTWPVQISHILSIHTCLPFSSIGNYSTTKISHIFVSQKYIYKPTCSIGIYLRRISATAVGENRIKLK